MPGGPGNIPILAPSYPRYIYRNHTRERASARRGRLQGHPRRIRRGSWRSMDPRQESLGENLMEDRVTGQDTTQACHLRKTHWQHHKLGTLNGRRGSGMAGIGMSPTNQVDTHRGLQRQLRNRIMKNTRSVTNINSGKPTYPHPNHRIKEKQSITTRNPPPGRRSKCSGRHPVPVVRV